MPRPNILMYTPNNRKQSVAPCVPQLIYIVCPMRSTLNSPTPTALIDSKSPHRLFTVTEPLDLYAQRFVYSPEHKALLVADVHLGKAATFRGLGVPVPAGTTLENLGRLSDAIELCKPEALFFLGDLLHARAAHNPELLAKLSAWRQHHASIAMTLIRGNHDSKAGDPPADLNISVVEEPYRLGGLALCHHPQTVPGALVLAGHEHPVVVITGKGRSRARLPCFYLKSDQLILPSFGAFTGGYPVVPKPGESVFPVL